MKEIIVLGGGCFWCTEGVFQPFKGIESVEPGYAGGTTPNPTYEEVCAGVTGHAEVVRITFDPATISLRTIFTIFFASHDPTTLNRQGADVGTQYRSIILTTTEEQKAFAKAFIKEIDTSTSEGDGVVTEVKELGVFYRAEPEHHNYFEKHPEAAYCQIVISPKVKKVQEQFKELLIQKKSP
jgi:peptide-methionine (S)-S-oxide reductase